MRKTTPIKALQAALLTTASALILTACSQAEAPAPAATIPPVSSISAEALAQNNVAINDWFEEKFIEEVMRSPMSQTYLGMRGDDDGKWDEVSEAREQEDLQRSKGLLAELTSTFDINGLGDSEALSYNLMKASLEDEVKNFKWRNHGFPFNQMFGVHSDIPSFLINNHSVRNVTDAENYISRLEGINDYLTANVERADSNAAAGVLPPKFVFPLILSDVRNLIKGAPFDDGEPSTLKADFAEKLAELEISDEDKADLIARADTALKTSFLPAYKTLEASLVKQETMATDEDGVWRLPEGEAFYQYRLERMTTTDMSATQIHDLGLSEVARIHDEMREIMAQVSFEGSLKEFFDYMREDPDGKFTYPTTEEGKARYLTEAEDLINVMKTRLDEVFIKKPKADLIVKAVEPFREQSAGKAFYQRPAPDGSRPGIYYANLYDMKDMPVYQMEALAYHEGIPGHHMQLAISQELEGIPKFRKYGGYTAYTEGWGLYSEYLPKEMGFYEDPYSDFGRLAMELWRAARLVVDTGLHDKKWTREEAIEYLFANTPNAENDCRKSIERYIVLPGQATSYKIGMLKIQELRSQAKSELGADFDIREFHDVVLASGPVPLYALEDRVNAWVASKS